MTELQEAQLIVSLQRAAKGYARVYSSYLCRGVNEHRLDDARQQLLDAAIAFEMKNSA